MPELTQLKTIVATMQPGEWREIPDTQIPLLTRAEHDAIVAAVEGSPPFWRVQGSSGAFQAYSGGAFDPIGYQWFFTGGGGPAYGGNEVYRFSFDSLSWERLTDPSAYDPETGAPFDGPMSYHTYDSFAWNPVTQTVWLGGASPYRGAGYQTQQAAPGVWQFDPDDTTWTFHPSDHVRNGWNVPTQLTFDPHTGGMFGYSGKGSSNAHIKFMPDGSSQRVWIDGFVATHRSEESIVTAKDKIYVFGMGRGDYRWAITEIADGMAVPLLREWPQVLIDRTIHWGGVDYDPVHDRFVIWIGGDALWTWDFADQQIRRFDIENGPSIGHDVRGLWEKFVYLPDVDAFAAYSNHDGNVYLLKAPLPEHGRVLDSDADRARIGDATFTSIQEAFDAAKDGDTVTILPGVWQEGATIKANNLTIEGDGAHLKNITVGGKATFVIQGDNTTVRGLEVSGMQVGDGNGAAIRQEGKNLTLEGVYFHDGQQGILMNNHTGTCIIKNSKFERLGHGGRAHGIYINWIDELIVMGCTFLSSKGQGHEIKSRAAKTTIENSVVASLDGNDSRLIDIPNGGEIVIRNNVLQMGPQTANNDAIGINLEQRGGMEFHWSVNTILIEGNIIISDRGGSNDRLLHYRDWEDNGYPTPVLVGNTVVGFSAGQVPEGNLWYASRVAAELAPYPYLPPLDWEPGDPMPDVPEPEPDPEPEPEPIPDEVPALADGDHVLIAGARYQVKVRMIVTLVPAPQDTAS